MLVTDKIHGFFWQSMTANNCNTYLLDGPTRILIDPGHVTHFDHVRRGLQNLNLRLEDIGLVICTHAHPDHIEAVQLLKKAGARFALHADEWQLVASMEKYLNANGLDLNSFTPDFFLTQGELSVKGVQLEVYHSPGHSPGSVCLYWSEKKALFTGDVIFKDGLGRTDLPGGNGAQLKASIQKLADLPAEYLLSGHGGPVSGAEAVRANFDQVISVWFNYI